MNDISSHFAPVHLLCLVSGILAYMAYQAKGRRHMLSFKLAADIIFAIYMYVLGGYAGMMSAIIACIGGLIQVSVPHAHMKRTLKIRIVMALVLSAGGIYFLADHIIDTYPFASTIASRFIELSSSTKVLRIGFMLTVLPWIVYNYANGFWFALAFNFFIMTVMALGLLKNERRITKDAIP
jgi:hypothetical protein